MRSFPLFPLRSPAVALVVLLAGLFLPSVSPAQEDPHGFSPLHFTNWSASAYSHRAAGTVCWITGPDGSLRLELRRGPAAFAEVPPRGQGDFPAGLDPLLHRSGQGWTLVLGPDDTGTLNEWSQEWRQPPAGLVQMVRLVVAALEVHPGVPPEFDFAEAFPPKQGVGLIPRPTFIEADDDSGEPGIWRYQMANLDPDGPARPPAGGFRERMAVRGRGTGGDREVVALAWSQPEGDRGSGVRIHSSRRPGTLDLEYVRHQRVRTPEPELFLPLWAMARFF